MNVRISAIICTLSRANYLRRSINSLIGQTLSAAHYETLIVDNGSTDNTSEVVLREYDDVQNLRYVYEPILGLSQARNTGWRQAAGEYVALLDGDDYWTSPHKFQTQIDLLDSHPEYALCFHCVTTVDEKQSDKYKFFLLPGKKTFTPWRICWWGILSLPVRPYFAINFLKTFRIGFIQYPWEIGPSISSTPSMGILGISVNLWRYTEYIVRGYGPHVEG